MEKNYIKSIREKIPHDKLMLIASGVVIVNSKNEILLQKRADNKLWGLPGGLKELDETIIQCAIREVKEETNLDVEIIDFIGQYTNPDMSWFGTDHAEVISFGFIAKPITNDLKINDLETLEFKYFSKDNLPKIHSVDNLEIIRDYYQNIRCSISGRQFK